MGFLEGYAIYSYEKLKINQPQFKTHGLYKEGYKFYIVCENLKEYAFDSEEDIVEYFNNKIRIVGCYIDLVLYKPKNAIKVKEYSEVDRIDLKGSPLNQIEFETKLVRMCENTIPTFRTKFDHNKNSWVVHSVINLQDIEKKIIHSNISKITGDYESEIIFLNTDKVDEVKISNKEYSSFMINISKSFKNEIPSIIIDKWEEDEQLWESKKTISYLDDQPVSNRNEKASCLLNGQLGNATNIRNYLTLFDEIQIIMPIEKNGDKEFFNSLGVIEEDLLKLIELNKVKLIYPNSVNRYDHSFLRKALEINNQQIVLSRELALNTIQDLKTRNPLFFTLNNLYERSEFIEELIRLKYNSEKRDQLIIDVIINSLRETSGESYPMVEYQGAMGTFNLGLTPMISELHRHLGSKDLFLEVMAASTSIEWAAAQSAVLCPIGPLKYNQERLASYYSGLNEELIFSGKPNLITEGILTICNHVPIHELATAFTSTEVNRLRKIIIKLTNNEQESDIGNVIEEFNKEVRMFEKRNRNLNLWDVQGTLIESATELASATVPFVGFILKQLGRMANSYGASNYKVGEYIDFAQGKLKKSSPNAVLVSRLRSKVKDLL